MQHYPMIFPDIHDNRWTKRSGWIHAGTGVLNLSKQIENINIVWLLLQCI